MLERTIRTVRLHDGRTFSGSPDNFQDYNEPYIVYRGGWLTKERIYRDAIVEDSEHLNVGVLFISVIIAAIITAIIVGAILVILSKPSPSGEQPEPAPSMLPAYAPEEKIITSIHTLSASTLPWCTLADQVSFELLAKGAQGEIVFVLQGMLKTVLNQPLTLNGLFQTETERAVKQFQFVQRLGVDGLVGDQTWKTLKQAYGCKR